MLSLSEDVWSNLCVAFCWVTAFTLQVHGSSSGLLRGKVVASGGPVPPTSTKTHALLHQTKEGSKGSVYNFENRLTSTALFVFFSTSNVEGSLKKEDEKN